MHPDHKQVRSCPSPWLPRRRKGAGPDGQAHLRAPQVDVVWQAAPGVGRDRMKRGILAYRAAYPDIRCALQGSRAAEQQGSRAAGPGAGAGAGACRPAAGGQTQQRAAGSRRGRRGLVGCLTALLLRRRAQVPGAPRRGMWRWQERHGAVVRGTAGASRRRPRQLGSCSAPLALRTLASLLSHPRAQPSSSPSPPLHPPTHSLTSTSLLRSASGTNLGPIREQPPTHRPVSFSGMTLITFDKQGRIEESHVYRCGGWPAQSGPASAAIIRSCRSYIQLPSWVIPPARPTPRRQAPEDERAYFTRAAGSD
jgi:hypothetical protein